MIKSGQAGSNNDRGLRWQTGSPGLSLTKIILPAQLAAVSVLGLPLGLRPPAAESTSATFMWPAVPIPVVLMPSSPTGRFASSRALSRS